jgi:hypothetical protein
MAGPLAADRLKRDLGLEVGRKPSACLHDGSSSSSVDPPYAAVSKSGTSSAPSGAPRLEGSELARSSLLNHPAQFELGAFSDHEMRRIGSTVAGIGVADAVVFLKPKRLRREGEPVRQTAADEQKGGIGPSL